MSNNIFEILKRQGWHVNQKACEDLLSESESPNKSLADIQKFLLNCDLNEIGSGWITEETARGTHQELTGPVVLQLVSCRNISQSKRQSDSFSQSKRLLCFELTDGKKKCKCIEKEHIVSMKDKMAPGTKVLLKKATVKCGIWLLGPSSLEVLGGRVEELAEEWEVLQQIENVRLKPKIGENAPPKFSHFNPNKHNKFLNQNLDNFSTKEALSSNPAEAGSKGRAEQEQRVVDVKAGQSVSEKGMNEMVRQKVLGEMRPDDRVYGRTGRGRQFQRREREETVQKREVKTLTLEEYEAQKKMGFNAKVETNINITNVGRVENCGATDPAKDIMMNLFSYTQVSAEADGYEGRGRRGSRGRGGRRGERRRGRY